MLLPKYCSLTKFLRRSQNLCILKLCFCVTASKLVVFKTVQRSTDLFCKNGVAEEWNPDAMDMINFNKYPLHYPIGNFFIFN